MPCNYNLLDLPISLIRIVSYCTRVYLVTLLGQKNDHATHTSSNMIILLYFLLLTYITSSKTCGAWFRAPLASFSVMSFVAPFTRGERCSITPTDNRSPIHYSGSGRLASPFGAIRASGNQVRIQTRLRLVFTPGAVPPRPPFLRGDIGEGCSNIPISP